MVDVGVAVEAKPGQGQSAVSGASVQRRLGTARPLGGFASLDSCPVETLARALGEDSRACVSIFNARHVVVWANRACRSLDVAEDRAVVGQRLDDLLPSEVAAERGEAMDEAMETGHVVRIHGMLGGTWAHSAYHPFETPSGERRVLVVTTSQAETRLSPLAAAPEGSRRARHDDWRHLAELTERERQVLRLLGFGLSTQEIANRLNRSVKTVQSHREALGTKLDVHNKSELARLAVCSGLTAVEEALLLGEAR